MTDTSDLDTPEKHPYDQLVELVNANPGVCRSATSEAQEAVYDLNTINLFIEDAKGFDFVSFNPDFTKSPRTYVWAFLRGIQNPYRDEFLEYAVEPTNLKDYLKRHIARAVILMSLRILRIQALDRIRDITSTPNPIINFAESVGRKLGAITGMLWISIICYTIHYVLTNPSYKFFSPIREDVYTALGIGVAIYLARAIVKKLFAIRKEIQSGKRRAAKRAAQAAANQVNSPDPSTEAKA